MAGTIIERIEKVCFVRDPDSGEPLNVKPECQKRDNFLSPVSDLFDPVQKEAIRTRDKIDAELARVPDNIDKATEKVKETVRGAFSDIFDILPGSGVLRLVGFGIGALIVLSILRRVGGS